MSDQTRAEMLAGITVNLRYDGRHVDAAWLEKEIIPLVKDAEAHHQTKDGVVVLDPEALVFMPVKMLGRDTPAIVMDTAAEVRHQRWPPLERAYSTRQAAEDAIKAGRE